MRMKPIGLYWSTSHQESTNNLYISPAIQYEYYSVHVDGYILYCQRTLKIRTPSFAFPISKACRFGQSTTTGRSTPFLSGMMKCNVRIHKHIFHIIIINIVVVVVWIHSPTSGIRWFGRCCFGGSCCCCRRHYYIWCDLNIRNDERDSTYKQQRENNKDPYHLNSLHQLLYTFVVVTPLKNWTAHPTDAFEQCSSEVRMLEPLTSQLSWSFESMCKITKL